MSVTPGGGGYNPLRWMASGRLTPAAATLTRISPSPGCGTGRCSGTSTSGPPGDLMPIAVMVAGIEVMASFVWIGKFDRENQGVCLIALADRDNCMGQTCRQTIFAPR